MVNLSNSYPGAIFPAPPSSSVVPPPHSPSNCPYNSKWPSLFNKTQPFPVILTSEHAHTHQGVELQVFHLS